MNEIYQIQIFLKGVKPKIWRRVLIPKNLSVSDFNKIIQTTMGWTNSHLHQFIKNRQYYTIKMEDDDLWDDNRSTDYSNMKISDLLLHEKEKILYEYDFGDGWEHEILLEKILPVNKSIKYPLCLKGKKACPPEDCGGIWGYAELVDIISEPNHEKHESTKEWLGDEFNPLHFDIDDINQLLQEKNYGCLSLW